MQVETAPEPMQLTIFTPLSQRIVDRIEAVDVNSLTPLQALNLLEELQQELKEKSWTEPMAVRSRGGGKPVGGGTGRNGTDGAGARMAEAGAPRWGDSVPPQHR